MKSKILILVSLILFISCDNDEESNLTQIPDGTYTGIFTVEYSNGMTYSNSVTINFSESNSYKSSGNGNINDFYPAGGSGTYEMKGSKISFYDINTWLAHFDWNLILSGEYDYLMNGSQLTISAYKNDVGFYKYELTKE